MPEFDLEALKALCEAEERSEQHPGSTHCPNPECGQFTWQCDCWQGAILEAGPAMVRELEKLRFVLSWYADVANYSDILRYVGSGEAKCPVMNDYGKKARGALK